MTLQHFAPRLVATIQKPLNILANGLYLLLVIVIVAGLAVASLARNIGLALFVGGLSGGQSGFLPILLAYMLLGTAVAVPYSIWIKRRIG
jgi:hypothetical protein